MVLSEVIRLLEDFAPLSYQESYDNSGLIIGHRDAEICGALLCVDVTEAIINEALELGANLIISHHPLIFKGLKRLTGANSVERMAEKAIRHGLAIYACHTNLDNAWGGVSFRMGEKIGLRHMRVLVPTENDLVKIVVFVPQSHAEKVREAICEAGAGNIGNYDGCTFNTTGSGTFRAGAGADPFVGKVGELHREQEIRIESIVPRHAISRVVSALIQEHPYEEVAYDLYPLLNRNQRAGSGVVGILPEPMSPQRFFDHVKKQFGLKSVRITEPHVKEIRTVSLCGGAGSQFLAAAIGEGADVFLTGDMKYHDFFATEGKIIAADIGHFESERFTIEIFYDLLTKKNSNFAVHKTRHITNPIIYI